LITFGWNAWHAGARGYPGIHFLEGENLKLKPRGQYYRQRTEEIAVSVAPATGKGEKKRKVLETSRGFSLSDGKGQEKHKGTYKNST